MNTLPLNETCSVCGQPDSFEDCNHKPLTSNDLRMLFSKTINPILILSEECGKYIMVED